jgi:hypothetical protein
MGVLNGISGAKRLIVPKLPIFFKSGANHLCDIGKDT